MSSILAIYVMLFYLYFICILVLHFWSSTYDVEIISTIGLVLNLEHLRFPSLTHLLFIRISSVVFISLHVSLFRNQGLLD